MNKNHKKNPIKNFLFLMGLLIVLTGILLPSVVHADLFGDMGALTETAFKAALSSNGSDTAARSVLDTVAGEVMAPLFTGIGQFLMTISSLFLVLSGKLFDLIVNFTVIDMAKNIGDGTGVGGGITAAWVVLRDIANMCFIFVLLFAAFKNMFQYNINNFGATIKNIIIVALLINFSLFFSKVVIDASNIVSVGFYKSIVTANEARLTTGTGLLGLNEAAFKGISGGYMKMLGMQTFYSANILDTVAGQPIKILTLGVVSSLFMLITAVILLISGIMFAARFIILIFLMILSPLALIAYIIPGQEKQFNSWKDSLISQSFFAPLFFALTWVVFKVGSTLVGAIPGNPVWTDLVTKADDGSMNLLLFYVLITGLSIAALVISKQMATSGATGGAFKAISGGIGTAAIGGAALAGRNTIGRASSLVSEKYRDTLSKNALGRSTLWLANKGKQSSFDARAVGDTKLMKSIGADKYANDMLSTAGKAGGKGGYTKMAEEKAKAKAAYAKDVYGKTDREKEEENEAKEKYEKGENKKNFDAAVKQEEESVKEAEKIAAEEKKKAEEDLKAKKEAEKKADPLNPAARDAAKRATAEAERVLREKETAHNESITKKKSVLDDKNYSEATKALEELAENDKKAWEKIKGASEIRLKEYAERLESGIKTKSVIGGVIGAIGGGLVGGIPGATIGAGIVSGFAKGGKEAARAVRKMTKEKTKAEKLADAAKEYQEEQDKNKKTEDEKSTPPPATPPSP